MRKPSLLWLNEEDISRVRARLFGLCMERDEYLRVASDNPWIPFIKIYPSSIVRFEWHEVGVPFPVTAWLKSSPRWDVERLVRVKNTVDGTIRVIDRDLPFSHKECRPAAIIVKHLARYFPFMPSPIATDMVALKII